MSSGEHPERPYRVIAEGDDAVGIGLSIVEALDVVQIARKRGKRHVAIVNDETGAMIDDFEARRLVRSQLRTHRPPRP